MSRKKSPATKILLWHRRTQQKKARDTQCFIPHGPLILADLKKTKVTHAHNFVFSTKNQHNSSGHPHSSPGSPMLPYRVERVERKTTALALGSSSTSTSMVGVKSKPTKSFNGICRVEPGEVRQSDGYGGSGSS